MTLTEYHVIAAANAFSFDTDGGLHELTLQATLTALMARAGALPDDVRVIEADRRAPYGEMPEAHGLGYTLIIGEDADHAELYTATDGLTAEWGYCARGMTSGVSTYYGGRWESAKVIERTEWTLR